MFSLGVFLIPFIVAKSYGRGVRMAATRRTAIRRGVAWAVTAAVLIALAWAAVFALPLVQAVASFDWPATKTLAQALRESGLFLSLIHI